MQGIHDWTAQPWYVNRLIRKSKTKVRRIKWDNKEELQKTAVQPNRKYMRQNVSKL